MELLVAIVITLKRCPMGKSPQDHASRTVECEQNDPGLGVYRWASAYHFLRRGRSTFTNLIASLDRTRSRDHAPYPNDENVLAQPAHGAGFSARLRGPVAVAGLGSDRA
jgi:hypothetical protein